MHNEEQHVKQTAAESHASCNGAVETEQDTATVAVSCDGAVETEQDTATVAVTHRCCSGGEL